MTHQFSVWAPEANTVEVVIDDDRHAMQRDERGWWRAPVAAAGAGTRYAFSLDGGPARPDPRSRSQPHGVDGPSEVVSDDFAWTDDRWRGLSWRGAVLYELHVGTFTPDGTFDAAIDRLDHVVELGVDAVELLPVAEFSGEHGWGYDGVDLFAPHRAYGGPDGLRRFVDTCHARDLGVVLDVVYNHLGPAGNYLREFGPYFSPLHRTAWGDAINYDGPGSDEVRRFVIDNASMWFRDYHVDGLRLDAVHAIVDDSARHIMEDLAIEIDALATHVGRPLFLVAESDRNDPRAVRSRHGGGWGLDSAWADEWHHSLHAVLTGERSGYYEDYGSLESLAKALRQAWVHDGTWSKFRQRHHGAPVTGLDGHHFVVCTQNHDQIGNRALGERMSALTSDGRLRVAAALLLTAPFTPLLFQGEEWGASTPFQYFTDHRDPELGRAVAAGRREEFAAFGWDPEQVPDPQDPVTFARSKLDWDELAKERHASLLGWYRELIALRRRFPDLGDPRLDRTTVEYDETERWLVVSRGAVRTLVNLGRRSRSFPLGRGADLLAASDAGVRLTGDGLTVPNDAVAIVRPGS